jgi:hypothetical protein
MRPPLGRWGRRLARQPMRRGLPLGLGCPASSSVGGGEDGANSNVVLPPRGKTSSIPPPAGGLSAAIVVVARRWKEYHVVVVVEGHELKTPETEHRPGRRGCWRLPIWSLTGSCSSTRSRPLPSAPTVGVSRPGGPSGRRVSVAACPSPDGSSAWASAKGGKERGGRRPA